MPANGNIYISQEKTSLTIHFPTAVETINQAEAATRKFLHSLGFGQEEIFPICLVMREGLLNAVKHGNRFDSRKIVKYRLRWEDDILTMEIEDEGDGFDWRDIQNDPPPIDSIHGRGIFIMRRYFSDYQYNETGNRIILSKYCPRLKPAESDRQASLESLTRTILKSPAIIKDVSDDELFQLIENLYVQRNKIELVNAEMHRAINWGARDGQESGETVSNHEEWYRILFENNPIETIIVDHQGRITEYNLAKKKAGDRLPEIGTVMYKDYAAQHIIDMHSELMSCLKTGQSKRFPELPYRNKILHIRISPFPDGAIITSVNITHLKQRENGLPTSATAGEEAQEEVVVINLDGIIEYANEAFLYRNNCDLKTAIGRNLFSGEVGLYDKALYEDIWRTLQQGESWTGLISRNDGSDRHEVAATISPVKDHTGYVVCYVSISRDLTHEARLQEQLREARRRQLVGAIADGVAYDFNNHLGAIMMKAELLSAEMTEGGKLRSLARDIRLAARKSRILANLILMFSGEDSAEKKPVQLAAVVREALSNWGTRLPPNIHLERDLSEEGALIRANSMQLQEIIVHLCDNAVAAMRRTAVICVYRSAGAG